MRNRQNSRLVRAAGLLALGPAILLCLVATLTPAAAGRRIALVIGNSNYAAVEHLPNPTHDAAAFAAMLRNANFDSVDLRSDLSLSEFKEALRDFTVAASGSDVAVFYYAGHGLEVGGSNLLVPVDAHLKTDLDAEDETVTVDRVLHAMEPVHGLRLVVLDACRENPFIPGMKRVSATRGVSRGLERIEAAPSDTMIAFATEPGAVADDGNGGNSPFTKALIDNVAKPGLDLRIALGKVRDDVLTATNGRQKPFVTGSLGGSNQPLVPETAPTRGGDAAPTAPEPPKAAPQVLDTPEADFNQAQATNTVAGWRAFLSLHPTGALANRAKSKIAMLTPAPPPSLAPSAAPNSLPVRTENGLGGDAPRTRDGSLSTFTYHVGGLKPNGDNFLSLRSGPSTSATELRRLSGGTALRLEERSGVWARVTTNDGDQGWAYAPFVVPNQTGSAPQAPSASYSFVTGLDPYGDNYLALKEAPDVGAARVLKMGPGTRLIVRQRMGEWSQVQLLDGRTGWASSRYIGCCAAGAN